VGPVSIKEREKPVRYIGKTLRHMGHLGAKKGRAATTVNTDARKYKIYEEGTEKVISITEAFAGDALRIFHEKCPSIQGVFHAGVVDALKEKRRLIAPLPYGIDAPHGGVRTFFERWGDELNRKAFAYLPQRTVTDNTKAAALRIKERISNIRIVLEAHDGLLFCIPKNRIKPYGTIIKEEMERAIDFSMCSLPRHSLVIPCELEKGMDYQHLEGFEL